MSSFISDLKKEFSGYNGAKFLKDLMAGLTVAAVALPLALAFGVSSGATAAMGLITAIICGFFISLFGGAFYQISGPTGAMAAILMSIIASYGIKGVFVATFIAGILLILCGVLRLGRLVSFIPMPVIAGFTSGIAVIIALGQLDNFFGVTSTGSSAVEKFLSYFSGGFSPNITSVIIGLAVIVFMLVFPKKWNAVVPASLIAIIIATAVSMIFGLDVGKVGEIPSTLIAENRLSFGDLDLKQIGGLISPAISIAALGMVESLLCGASAGRMTGVRLNSNRELIAQGIGNLLSPLFGGIPATAAIARTSVAVKSGAVTRLTGIIHSVFLLISMLLLGGVMSKIPLSALAGVLLVTAWRMNEWSTIKYIFSRKFKGAILKFCATMIATILFDLTVAILIGVIIGFVLLAVKLSKADIKVEKSDTATVKVDGMMFFANAEKISDLAEKLSDAERVEFSLESVPNIDVSAAHALLELIEELNKKSVSVTLSGENERVKNMFTRAGVYEALGEKQTAEM